jgi:hypothetical protein
MTHFGALRSGSGGDVPSLREILMLRSGTPTATSIATRLKTRGHLGRGGPTWHCAPEPRAGGPLSLPDPDRGTQSQGRAEIRGANYSVEAT